MDNTCAYIDNKNAQNTENEKIHDKSKDLFQKDRTICNLL